MCDTPLTLTVDEDGDRLDRWLADACPQFSRERLQALIREGRVAVNGCVVSKPSTRLADGDTVTLDVPDLVPLALAAEAIPLDVVYEDATLLVVNKPAGMLTHPAGREVTGTLVNALLAHCGDSLSGINGVSRPGIVHRLDRDTSGLLVVAKTDQAHRHLAAQIQARTAGREYHAIVQGRMPSDTGTVDAAIARNPLRRESMRVDNGGRHAVTHWTVLDTLGDRWTRVHLKLETGRTHQIRVHMAHIGHPVLGDPLYGTGVHRQLALGKPLNRQLLQAVRLTLDHPLTGERRIFECPEDPALREVWATLTGNY